MYLSIYIYIYIYIFMDVCVWVSVCVREWVVKKEILCSASLDGVGLSEVFCVNCSWLVFAPKMAKKFCPRELM